MRVPDSIVSAAIRLKKALNNDSTSLWQSLKSVSIKLVLWKRLGLFVTIRSTDGFTHVTSGIRFESKKVTHKSGK